MPGIGKEEGGYVELVLPEFSCVPRDEDGLAPPPSITERSRSLEDTGITEL